MLLCKCNVCDETVNLNEKGVFNKKGIERLGWTALDGQIHFCVKCTEQRKMFQILEEKSKDNTEEARLVDIGAVIKHEYVPPKKPTIEFIDRVKDDKLNKKEYYKCRYCVIKQEIKAGSNYKYALKTIREHEKEKHGNEYQPTPRGRGKRRPSFWI